jgi:hypothetical protein
MGLVRNDSTLKQALQFLDITQNEIGTLAQYLNARVRGDNQQE